MQDDYKDYQNSLQIILFLKYKSDFISSITVHFTKIVETAVFLSSLVKINVVFIKII